MNFQNIHESLLHLLHQLHTRFSEILENDKGTMKIVTLFSATSRIIVLDDEAM